jgi:SAM-dependent methyltransferase
MIESEHELKQVLLESAPLARKVAPVLCRPDEPSDRMCAWYHGFWQYLRLLGLAAAPQRHTQFFDEALGGLAGSGAQRLVITGSADYAMLAQVNRVWTASGAGGELAVVDACETPLFLCKWYAKLRSLRLTAHACDILRWTPAAGFDVACTHSFMAQFPRSTRGKLIAAWRRALKPGGRVVTTTRVDDADTPERFGFTGEQVAAFADSVFERAHAIRERLDIDPEELRRRAASYAEKVVSHPVTSRAELVELFEQGGFQFERLELVTLAGAVDSAAAGPTTSKRATYAHIVARRV